LKRRRNRKLRDKLLQKNNNQLQIARKYQKFQIRNKIRNNIIHNFKEENNKINKENDYLLSPPKTSIKRIKYKTKHKPFRRRNSTISVKPAATAPPARINQYLNSSTTFQLNSSAEANYVALRRNIIKPHRLKVTNENAARKPKSIKYLVGNMIENLKDELDHLLMFNENLLHFDKSIVKNAAKTKVEEFFDSLSTAIDSQTKVTTDCLDSKKDKLEAASNILNVTEDISRTLASTLSLGSTTEIKLANISMAVIKKKLSDNTSSAWETEDMKVTLPDQENIADNSSIAVSFTSYHNLGSLMNGKDDIRSPVLSVNVVRNQNQNQKRSIPLTKPIEFVLYHKPLKKVRRKKCVFWDFKYSAWSKDGCYTLRKKSTSTTTACECYHLTNFALKLEDEDVEDDYEDEDEDEEVTTEISKLKFGDKIIPKELKKVNAIVNDENKFKVYRVTPETDISIDIINNPKPHLAIKQERESFQPSYSKQSLPLLNTRTPADNDYEYYWEEFEKQEENKLWKELPSDVGSIQEYESLKILV